MAEPADTLDWETHRAGWPLAEASRFVEAGGVRWHVQVMGRGPVMLLVHGTGASTHSWRAMMPRLAERFTVVAADLPGHGFSSWPPAAALTLPGMAAALGALVRALAATPHNLAEVEYAAGHSAGAAVLLRMCLGGAIAPRLCFCFNGALLPLGGGARFVFPPLARLVFGNPMAMRFFARRGTDRGTVERLLRGTGSQLDAQGIDLYAALFASQRHVAAALGMMANWDLAPLRRDLPQLSTPLVLMVGGADASISPDSSFRVRGMVPGATVRYFRGAGHLMHEVSPAEMTAAMLAEIDAQGTDAAAANQEAGPN